MIQRKHRFHGSKSLRFVYQHGSTTRNHYFLLKSTINPRREDYRLAVIVSRKVHKSAVARNRIRRRLYAAFWATETEVTKPFDLVITVLSGDIIDISPETLRKLIKKQLLAAGVISTQ
jgi:ribonuclease P protein component